LVSYDVVEDRRRTRVYKAMRGFGNHVQFSVFVCDLSDKEIVEMRAALNPLIDHDVDQVLIASLGSIEGRGEGAIESVGRGYRSPERRCIIG
jgi:CRISPR-associated protein Cas2